MPAARPRSHFRQSTRKLKRQGCYLCGARVGTGVVMPIADAFLWCCSKEHALLVHQQIKGAA
jgi:hypothetical protein